MRRILLAVTIGLIVFALLALILLKYNGGPTTAMGVPEKWDDARSMVLAQVTQATPAQTLQLAYSPLFPGINIVYAVPQTEGGYILVTKDELIQWDIGGDVLHNQAVKNLARKAKASDLSLAQVNIDSSTKYITIETNDGFAAARIILDEVRENVKDLLGEPYVVAMPTRDFLIFWPENFGAATQFITQVEREFAAEPEFPLTPRLFRFSNGAIEISNEEQL